MTAVARMCASMACVRCRGRTGPDLRLDERLQRGLVRQLAKQPNARPDAVPIPVGGEQVLLDARRRPGVGRRQPDLPAGFRAQHDQPAREAVGKRLRERRQIGARLEQRRGDEEQLDVGNWLARIAFEERGGPTRQVGCETGAEDEALGNAQSQAVEPHVVLERAAWGRA